ncbi:MAG: hypothetical protein IPQ05_16895 [Leptospiraceae bacterium]|nr:hypothetical protein [Leptospiraceae bacterium]MBK7057369.1 hypothetical protein [Leptospiraceae bacterium]MBL0265489.1 hypothetical protein [Leptospiraceae bacterium]
MIEELNPIAIDVEIVKLEKLLIVFADGARLVLRYNDIEFSCNFCDTSLFDPYDTYENVSKVLYPGRKFRVMVELTETSTGHYAKKLSSPILPEIQEVYELDWIMKGKTISDSVDELILVDCGIPILAFSNEEINQKGEYGEWFGELKVWLSDEITVVR